MQNASFRNRTRAAESISYDDNRNTTSDSSDEYVRQFIK